MVNIQTVAKMWVFFMRSDVFQIDMRSENISSGITYTDDQLFVQNLLVKT